MYGSTLDVRRLILSYSFYEETFSTTQKLPEKSKSLTFETKLLPIKKNSKEFFYYHIVWKLFCYAESMKKINYLIIKLLRMPQYTDKFKIGFFHIKLYYIHIFRTAI